MFNAQYSLGQTERSSRCPSPRYLYGQKFVRDDQSPGFPEDDGGVEVVDRDGGQGHGPAEVVLVSGRRLADRDAQILLKVRCYPVKQDFPETPVRK